MNKKILAHIGLLLTNLFFAANLSTIKYLTAKGLVVPFGLNIIRIGISVILFWVLYLLNPEKVMMKRKDIIRLVICAIMALALNQMLFIKGLYYTFSIHVALLFLITPILIIFIATWMLKERINMKNLIGLLLGIVGALILIKGGKNNGAGQNILLGDSLIILSALAYTFYFILVKPLMSIYPPMFIMRWIFTIGFFLCLPFSYSEFQTIHFSSFTAFDFFILFLIVIPGTFLAYVFNLYGIKELSASIAGTYIYVQPVFAVLIAMIFLKEPLALYKIEAGVVIFLGVWLASRKRVVAR